MKHLFAATAFLAAAAVTPALACEDGHWIETVTDAGEIIILEDSSVWQVDPFDQSTSMVWLPTTDVVACDYMLINTEDSEKVAARKIR